MARTAINFNVPQQDLAGFSFTGPRTRDLNQWLGTLDQSNVASTAKQLYQAAIELNHLQCDSAKRLALLEALRPHLHYSCLCLNQHFIEHGVVLNNTERKIAGLAQGLQNQLAIGYKIVTHRMLQRQDLPQEDFMPQLALCLHRGISDSGKTLLRCYQLYCPIPEGLWLEMYLLFRLAKQYQLQQSIVLDQENTLQVQTTLQQAFLKSVLLSAIKPNQLRQQELGLCFELLELWSDACDLLPQKQIPQAVHIVPLQHDRAPFNRKLYGQGPKGLALNCQPLLQIFSQNIKRLPDTTQHTTRHLAIEPLHPLLPAWVGASLVQHIYHSLAVAPLRHHQRQPARGQIAAALGLSAGHHYSSGKRDFAIQLSDSKTPNQSKTADDDIEAISLSSPGGSNFTDQEVSYPRHELLLVDASLGGYCGRWLGEVPKSLQIGELLTLQKAIDSQWQVAVVRWIQQTAQKGTQIGVEILSKRSMPVGVKLMGKTKSHQFQRSLLIPGEQNSAQLLTPALNFKENAQVILNQHGQESQVLLTKQLSANRGYRVFEIQWVE